MKLNERIADVILIRSIQGKLFQYYKNLKINEVSTKMVMLGIEQRKLLR